MTTLTATTKVDDGVYKVGFGPVRILELSPKGFVLFFFFNLVCDTNYGGRESLLEEVGLGPRRSCPLHSVALLHSCLCGTLWKQCQSSPGWWRGGPVPGWLVSAVHAGPLFFNSFLKALPPLSPADVLRGWAPRPSCCFCRLLHGFPSESACLLSNARGKLDSWIFRAPQMHCSFTH